MHSIQIRFCFLSLSLSLIVLNGVHNLGESYSFETLSHRYFVCTLQGRHFALICRLPTNLGTCCEARVFFAHDGLMPSLPSDTTKRFPPFLSCLRVSEST
ncbi:hypothetical protein BJ170DRAFT_619400 [Xylariales sp. AK1849]|nr:hypothetical protein BJ170DRAFT_619400 [Xylariales sp. AK1849]